MLISELESHLKTISDIPTPDILDKSDIHRFEDTAIDLLQILNLIKKAFITIDSIKYIPEKFMEMLFIYGEELLQHINNLRSYELKTVSISEYHSNFNSIIINAQSYYARCMEISSSNNFLFTINSINSFNDSNNTKVYEVYEELKISLQGEITKAQVLNKELEDKAANSIVSNYAKIFDDQEKAEKKNADTWLLISIGLTVLLLIFMVVSFYYDWFAITYIKGGSNTVSINFPNLITKFFIISFVVYIISFCFKQYSIRMHLQSLSNHRKNALNSYRLFVESMGNDDSASKNSLLIQVAKAIYEQTSTGYLSTKQNEASTPNIIEFTKYVSAKS